MMRAVSGYYDDGRFTPVEAIVLPKRIKAIMVFEDLRTKSNNKSQKAWFDRFHAAVKDSVGEEMPDFPRLHFGRELIDWSNEA